MFQSLRRDRNHWFRNPFRKPKKPVRENPPRFLQWTNPAQPDPAESIGQYQRRGDNAPVVMPTALPLKRWERLLTTRAAHSGHDVIAAAIGTPMRLLTHFHDFIINQQPDTNNIALLLAASCTDGDTASLAQCGAAHPAWTAIQTAQGKAQCLSTIRQPTGSSPGCLGVSSYPMVMVEIRNSPSESSRPIR
jgi:hypothetical protein